MLLTTDNFNKFNSQSFSLTMEKCPAVSDMVQSISVPGLTMGEVNSDTPFSTRKEPGDKIIYSVMSITVLLDEELKAWKEVFDWINGLGFPESYQQYRKFAASAKMLTTTESFSDAILSLYNNQQKAFARLHFNDLFPIALGDIPLATVESSDDFPVVTMDFQYRSYGVELIT